MNEPPADRYWVLVDEGPPRGDLYELEQTTTYRVVDARSNETVLSVEGRLTAHLSAETGQWEDAATTGALGVELTPDGGAVIVRWADGREETIALPAP